MATTLTDRQAHALFHYLVQAQAWHELSSLKVPGRISHSGPPFVPDPATPARAPSPVLNALFRRLFLTLPGVRDAPVELWSVHAQGVLEDMAAQDLSDSFDKGALSKRKIVAYGIAVVASAAGRGLLGGLPRRGAGDGRTGYDPEKGEDVRAAWESVREGMVYGDDLHELVDWAAKTVSPYTELWILALMSSRTTSPTSRHASKPHMSSPRTRSPPSCITCLSPRRADPRSARSSRVCTACCRTGSCARRCAWGMPRAWSARCSRSSCTARRASAGGSRAPAARIRIYCSRMYMRHIEGQILTQHQDHLAGPVGRPDRAREEARRALDRRPRARADRRD
jgi:hypothetical protein